jgi:hypothetical protein
MPIADLFLGEDEMFTSMPICKMAALGILTDETVRRLTPSLRRRIKRSGFEGNRVEGTEY